jgi:mono/diheme cytochrome c family protein/glucose/arabinose dehydrogenase
MKRGAESQFIRLPSAWSLLAVFLLIGCIDAFGQQGNRRGEGQSARPAHLKPPPSPALSPDAALKTIQLPEGFRLELVASEPMVQDPIAVTFDEDGRIWVVEMRGFMPDLDGKGETEPVGRISILEDTDGDGHADKSIVFLDGLVLPRSVTVVKGGALIADHQKLWFVEDTDGDGRADRKTVIDPDYAGGGNPEHQGNGLLRALDNWYYNAKSSARYRRIGGRWVKEKTEFRGQWVIAQDDYGRLFYNYNWSQLHGDVVPPNALMRNPNHPGAAGLNVSVAAEQSVHPIRMNTGINRGYRAGVLDEQGRVREYASACAPLIYRGDYFPPDFNGNAFVCDPSANIVARHIVWEDGLDLKSRRAYDDREFIASTDERFRPVSLANGPDGTLYVVDMYRGIIQHRAYMTSFLRGEILERGLAAPIHLGRIYRVVQTGRPPQKPPRLSKATSAELVSYLSHANGWIRDTAQRLLVEGNDTSIAPRLIEVALGGKDPLGRIHALWTMEGLRGRNSALDLKLGQAVRKLAASGDPTVRLHAALVTGCLGDDARSTILHELAERDADSAMMRDAILSSAGGLEMKLLKKIWDGTEWRSATPGPAILIENLAAATVRSRRAGDVDTMMAMLDEPADKRGPQHDALLGGILAGGGMRGREPLRLGRAPRVLQRRGEFPEGPARKRLDRLAALFEWPGHSIPARTRQGRSLTEAEQRQFAEGRQLFLQTCAVCHGPDGSGLKPLGPPLLDSEWVMGPPERIVRIVLHGLEGPIHVNGATYAPPDILPAMPSVAGLSDTHLAAIFTYIRRDWGHEGTAVSPSLMQELRETAGARETPWTEKELLQVVGSTRRSP